MFEKRRSRLLRTPGTPGDGRAGIMLVLLSFVLFASVYANIVPPFEGPDAGGHLRYVAYLRQQRVLPTIDLQTAQFSHELILQPPLYYALTALFTPAQDVQEALRLDLVNPYYRLGLSRRATVAAPGVPATFRALWIARGLAMLGGLLAVLGTWLLCRTLLPRSPWVALAAAAIVGLNPQFLFTSASITNDTWPTALAVLTLWFAVRTVRRDDQRWAPWLGIGMLAGLGAVTKYSNLLVSVPLALVLLPYLWQRRSLRSKRGLYLATLAGLGMLLTGSFWYLRNLALYGSPIPMGTMLGVLPGIARQRPASLAEIWAQLPVVLRSYWGIYGYGILAQPWFYSVVQWMMALGACGLLVFLLLHRWSGDVEAGHAMLIAGVWLAAVCLSAGSYMRQVRYADQGRLIFSAAPAVALLLVLGWQAPLPRMLGSWLMRLVPVAFVVLAASQVSILREGYRLPPRVPEPLQAQRPMNAEFAGGMKLVGLDLPGGGAIDAKGALPITLYLSTEREITGFYTLFMHLTDADGRMLWQFDGVPSAGRHPTRQWVPGQTFADSQVIQVGDIERDGLGTLSIGFYPYDDPSARQPLVNAGSNVDRVVVKVRLHAQRGDAEAEAPPPRAAWSNGIQLESAAIATDSAGMPRRVTLEWRSQANVQTDYTASVQVLNDQGKLLAQADKQPGAGTYPTSTWRAGDRVADTFALPEISQPWQRVILVLYDDAGRRLPLQAGAETAGDDYFELARR